MPPAGTTAPAETWSAGARFLGIASAVAVVVVGVAYLVTLAMGLLSLASPDDPIGDPWFTLLEMLILVQAPALVTLMAAVHAWASERERVWSLAGLVFMTLMAGITCSVHFVILTVSRDPAVAESSWMPHLLSFTWPSVAYALDILAWDVFFALAVLLAAPVFRGGSLGNAICATLVVSGVLSLAGLVGVFIGDMQVRNIGIVGYAVVFPVAAFLLARLFQRSASVPAAGTPRR